MSLEERRESVRWFFETDFDQVVAGMDQHVTADYRYHSPTGDSDRAGYADSMGEILRAFPDVRFKLRDLVAEGNKVASHWELTGTHRHEYMGIPATNRKIKLSGLTIDYMRGSQVSETWSYYNTMDLLQQLGVGGPAA